jgi:hypothetical protein
MRRLNSLAFLVLAAIPAACAPPVPQAPVPPPAPAPQPDPAPPPQQACTMIGCDNGWAVEVVGAAALPANYTMRVIVDGAVVASVNCSPEQPCGDRVFLPGVTAEEAELEIVGANVPLRWTVRPSYDVVQPNGPNCPPTCRQARVQVRLTDT